jgi:hypothetical protein
MDMLQTKGIDLPTFGNDKMKLDTRTGFYVLPQVIPMSLRVPLPEGKSQPYRFLAIPLDSAEAKKRAMSYILMFRNVIPEKFMEKYGIDKGYGLPRAMVFDRPPVMARVFDEIGIQIPETFRNGIRRAAALYQKEVAKKPSGKPAGITYGAMPEGTQGTLGTLGPVTPPLNNMPSYAPVTPPLMPSYAPVTPPLNNMPSYGAVSGGPTTPTFTLDNPTTPPFTALAPVKPNSPAMVNAIKRLRQGVPIEEIALGGYGAKPLTQEEIRKLRDMPPNSPKYVPGLRKTRVSPQKGGARKTRRVKHSLEEVAKLFSKVWKKRNIAL